MKEHVTKDGKSIPLDKLADRHLENIIKSIEKRAVEGIIVRHGGGTTADDMWMEEETIYGEFAKLQLGYKDYVDELNSRKAAQG